MMLLKGESVHSNRGVIPIWLTNRVLFNLLYKKKRRHLPSECVWDNRELEHLMI